MLPASLLPNFAVGLGEQGRGAGVSFGVGEVAANEFGTRGDVAPLVGTAHLQAAAVGFVEALEVVGLQQLVTELGEGETRLQAVFDGVFGEHVAHRQGFTDGTQEVEDVHLLVEVDVVDQDGGVGPLEVEEFVDLLFLVFQVPVQFGVRLQHPFFVLAGRVADAARSAAHEHDGAVAGVLEEAQEHDLYKVANGHGRGGGVEANIAYGGSGG